MKKAVTLIELIIVMLIIGILAVSCLAIYRDMIERARCTEARQILAGMAEFARAYYMEHGTLNGIELEDLNIGIRDDQYPPYNKPRRPGYYFIYGFSSTTPTQIHLYAYYLFCIPGEEGQHITLYLDFATGIKEWSWSSNLNVS